MFDSISNVRILLSYWIFGIRSGGDNWLVGVDDGVKGIGFEAVESKARPQKSKSPSRKRELSETVNHED